MINLPIKLTPHYEGVMLHDGLESLWVDLDELSWISSQLNHLTFNTLSTRLVKGSLISVDYTTSIDFIRIHRMTPTSPIYDTPRNGNKVFGIERLSSPSLLFYVNGVEPTEVTLLQEIIGEYISEYNKESSLPWTT